jgi:hypothetical protein
MLCKFMLHGVFGNLYGSRIITKKKCGASQETPKSANSHRSHIISEVVVASGGFSLQHKLESNIGYICSNSMLEILHLHLEFEGGVKQHIYDTLL